MATLNDRYPDLLAAASDPKTARFVDDLDTFCAETTTPAHLRAAIGQALYEQATRQRDHAARRRFTPFPWLSRPLAMVAVAVLALAIVGGGAYAVVPLIDQAFFNSTGQAIVQQHLAREVHLSQTACGLTMTIERVYADADRVAVGYTLAGTPPHGAAPAPHVTTTDGASLAPIAGTGTGIVEGTDAEYQAYDSGGVVGGASQINLRLTAPWVKVVDSAGHMEPGPLACQQPFSFNLSVPVTPGRIVNVHQTDTHGGGAVTLEKVSLTPAGTSLYVSGQTVPTTARLIVDGQTHYPESGTRTRYDFGPLMDKHGDWTIIMGGQGQAPEGSDGTWTFHVTVP